MITMHEGFVMNSRPQLAMEGTVLTPAARVLRVPPKTLLGTGLDRIERPERTAVLPSCSMEESSICSQFVVL